MYKMPPPGEHYIFYAFSDDRMLSDSKLAKKIYLMRPMLAVEFAPLLPGRLTDSYAVGRET